MNGTYTVFHPLSTVGTVDFNKTMRVFLCFTAIIAVCYGYKGTWLDFRGGDIVLPFYESEAKDQKWVACEKDTNLKITWYRKDIDESLAIAFDEGGNCAGAKITILHSNIDAHFEALYKQSKGIFEKIKVNDAVAYESTVLFASEKTLKNGGRTLGDVTLDVYVKTNGKYTLLSKDGCTTAKTYTEQSCKPNYGQIFSSFTKKTNCKKLTPIYAVYDPKNTGQLIGFGWISFHKVSYKETFFKAVTEGYILKTFPNINSCVKHASYLAVTDVWFSYSSSQKTSCKEPNWTKSHCKKKKKSSSSSSSSDSDSSDSSSDSS